MADGLGLEVQRVAGDAVGALARNLPPTVLLKDLALALCLRLVLHQERIATSTSVQHGVLLGMALPARDPTTITNKHSIM